MHPQTPQKANIAFLYKTQSKTKKKHFNFYTKIDFKIEAVKNTRLI